MQEAMPEANIECLDLPGNGFRSKETSPLEISAYVKDLHGRSRFVKQKEPFQVLALSMGAMIAVDWMHSFPHEIEKAFLVCTSSARHSKFYERFRPKNLLTGFPILTAKNSDDWENVILDIIVNDPQRRAAEFPALTKFSEEHPIRVENIFRQLFAASRYRFPKKPPGDISLLGTYGDRLVAPECTLQLAKSWGVRPEMHTTSGHDIPIDDPHWLIEHLL
jgi:pimeloyl-ACP methyl ester carboxylesterase